MENFTLPTPDTFLATNTLLRNVRSFLLLVFLTGGEPEHLHNVFYVRRFFDWRLRRWHLLQDILELAGGWYQLVQLLAEVELAERVVVVERVEVRLTGQAEHRAPVDAAIVVADARVAVLLVGAARAAAAAATAGAAAEAGGAVGAAGCAACA